MHQPRPYGLHVIGLPLTNKDDAFISSVAKKITNLKDVSKVDSLKMVYDLPDGGYVIVQDVGGNFRVIAHKPIHGKDPVFDGIETDYVPMLFSGVVTKSRVYKNDSVGLKLTDMACFRLTNYNHLETKPKKNINLQRFNIDYNYRVAEFKPRVPSDVLVTQYSEQRPTWYSGAMAEVMQIVGGYGRQDFANLPDKKVNKFERARVVIPAEWLDKINKELVGLRLPAYSGLPPADGSFQFDYKFNNTNGVGFDEKNRPWLLRVGGTGVYAMPLPIVPATRTKAFRRYMELVGDDEIVSIISRFGGMPSGESFPVSSNFEAWRRAGVIIKICDSSDFYSHIMYSSACGWSFNKLGTEAYNTCYDYYDEIGYGSTYKLKINLVSTEQYFGAEPVELVEAGPIADKVRLYLSQLMPTLSSKNNDDKAILYKLRRSKSGDIYQRALGRNGKDDRDYWNNLEMKPIANHSGNMSEVYGGWLYHPAKFEYQPQIKFPEPLAGACLSHDFLPLREGRYRKAYPNSDTIMFAYFIGDYLKVVKYFIDWSDFFIRKSEGNFEKYMTVGNFKQIDSLGSTQIQGNFYSSDIDDRELVSESTVTTTIRGEDAGYDSQPFFEFDDFFSQVGTLWRHRYFTHDSHTKRVNNYSAEVAVCIPYLNRNAVLQTYRTSSSESNSRAFALLKVLDPHSYRYWTYDKIWAWRGGDLGGPAKGKPHPVDGSPVWVEVEKYNPSPANDFADNGSWINGLPQDYTWIIHPDNNTWQHSGGGGPPSIDPISEIGAFESKESGRVSVSLGNQSGIVNKDMPDNRYYISSPSEMDLLFYRDAANIVFGRTVYSNVSEKNTRSNRASFGYCSLVDGKSAHHFIGVINE